MKEHNGMRPQDIAILLYLSTLKTSEWKLKDVAQALQISQSEVSEAVNRCVIAHLIDKDSKKVFRFSLAEFLKYGLRYVFPVVPGTMERGVPTAHSAPPLNDFIVQDDEPFVWPHPDGTVRGLAVKPLYRTLPGIVADKPEFYALLALCDAVRVGRVREVNLAKKELEKRILA